MIRINGRRGEKPSVALPHQEAAAAAAAAAVSVQFSLFAPLRGLLLLCVVCLFASASEGCAVVLFQNENCTDKHKQECIMMTSAWNWLV